MDTTSLDYLDSEAASKYIGVSRRAVESWRQRGIGPPYHKVGRLVRYTASDIDAWLESVRVVPETQKAAGQ